MGAAAAPPDIPLETGRRTAAVLYTVVLTCQHLGIAPLTPLREALSALFAQGENPSAEALPGWLPDRGLLRRAPKAAGREASTG